MTVYCCVIVIQDWFCSGIVQWHFCIVREALSFTWSVVNLAYIFSGSQWLRGLKRVSAAARLLELRVRIPPWAWCVVSGVCCQVEVSA